MIEVYYTTHDGDGHATVWALLARALGGELPPVARTANGKPYFTADGVPTFSLSHTKTLAVVALSRVGMPLGVDAEPCTRRISAAVARRFLEGDATIVAWTRRESFGKLTGEGVAAQQTKPDARHAFVTMTAADHVLTVCTLCGEPVAQPREL